jgi:hypothetical protein
MEREISADVDAARDLLERAHLREMTGHLLAAAQVHATLALEAAVRDLITITNERDSAHDSAT